jgi:hypothetical protein
MTSKPPTESNEEKFNRIKSELQTVAEKIISCITSKNRSFTAKDSYIEQISKLFENFLQLLDSLSSCCNLSELKTFISLLCNGVIHEGHQKIEIALSSTNDTTPFEEAIDIAEMYSIEEKCTTLVLELPLTTGNWTYLISNYSTESQNFFPITYNNIEIYIECEKNEGGAFEIMVSQKEVINDQWLAFLGIEEEEEIRVGYSYRFGNCYVNVCEMRPNEVIFEYAYENLSKMITIERNMKIGSDDSAKILLPNMENAQAEIFSDADKWFIRKKSLKSRIYVSLHSYTNYFDVKSNKFPITRTSRLLLKELCIILVLH